jgi:hypothetical protein
MAENGVVCPEVCVAVVAAVVQPVAAEVHKVELLKLSTVGEYGA